MQGIYRQIKSKLHVGEMNTEGDIHSNPALSSFFSSYAISNWVFIQRFEKQGSSWLVIAIGVRFRAKSESFPSLLEKENFIDFEGCCILSALLFC